MTKFSRKRNLCASTFTALGHIRCFFNGRSEELSIFSAVGNNLYINTSGLPKQLAFRTSSFPFHLYQYAVSVSAVSF